MKHVNNIDDSIESYLHTKTSTTQRIYIITVIAVIVAIASLPFIYVDISIQGTGVIRPKGEKTEIKASVSEYIDSIYVHEGQLVKEGDVLLRLRSSNVGSQIDQQEKMLQEYTNRISDLEVLVLRKIPSEFNSPWYEQEYKAYKRKMNEAQISFDKANQDYNRNSILYEKGIIAAEEHEGYVYARKQALNNLATIRESQYSTWQSALNSYKEQLIETESSLYQGEKNLDLYYVKSPIDGTLDLFSGIYVGGSVRTGEVLAIISPNSLLYAEIYVSPRDIGNIIEGMPVTIQIESFNYNEWGMVTGVVTEISSDFFMDNENGNSYYKVRCSLEDNHLSLPNGRKGYFKKGMSIRANFIINQRSLFDLLYMKADEVFNPRQY